LAGRWNAPDVGYDAILIDNTGFADQDAANGVRVDGPGVRGGARAARFGIRWCSPRPGLYLESIDIDVIERGRCLFADSRQGPDRRPPGRRSCSGGDGEPPRSKMVFIT
jgi:hypothetical protein